MSAIQTKILARVLSFLLVRGLMFDYGTVLQAQTPQGGPSYQGQGAPQTAAELQNLVSPIALYPDALVAQILSAATYPDQVAAANNWMQQNKNLTGSALMTAVNEQSWDPSVKALCQFPSVLSNMAQNLSWTSALGEAHATQQGDVMTAIQTLRAKAYAAGNLKSGSQITVVQQSPQTIVIQPANPQVVYVPAYNPAVVYGTPYNPPGYSTADLVTTSLLSFGAGIAVGAMMSGGCCGWGWSSWNCNWYGGGVYYHGGAYYGNAAWHGGYYGTSGAAYGPYGSAHYGAGYNPSTGTYARGGSVSTPYGTASAGQAYNPRTGTYAQGGSVQNAYGKTSAGQAYNPYTGAYGATHQNSNAYGSSGSSTFSKNGQTVDTQHYSNANGNVGTAESSNGNKYATANGNAYKNTGSGWQKESNGSWNNVQKPTYNSDAAHGWGSGSSGTSGSESHASGSSAFSGSSGHSGSESGGWQSRADSSRGWASRGGGGGWGGGGFRR
ncbi:MAG: DUF3300 domain-containing protein [Acidobacteriaceae bacterium]|nr:DUF3300 domain-containing protein [Acidobacteriaceae bacterium]